MPVAVSLMLPYLFGLGVLLSFLCASIMDGAVVAEDTDRGQRFATCLVFGLLLNHSLALLLSDLKSSLVVGCSLSVAALIVLAAVQRRRLRKVISVQWLFLSFVLYLACLYVVLAEPLDGWDARSIWFFHGKMIFYNASIDAGGDWTLSSIGFSHTDYPEMVPILAAQIASVAGYWNEYLPKMSLVALLLPALLLLFSIFGGKSWQTVFIAVPLLFTGVWLKNGYMDGYLALYGGLAAFYLGRWLDNANRMDLVSGVLATGVVLDLKNEGMLYALIVTALLCSFLLSKRIRHAAQQSVRLREDLPLLIVALSGWVLWERKKQLFHLKNDLQLGFSSLETLLHRLSEGSLALILKSLYVTYDVNLSLGIFLLSLVWSVRKGRRPGRGALFCALVAILYFAGIVMIYLATPFDLVSFHLPTGNRTMLPVHMLLLAASLSLFQLNGSPAGVSGSASRAAGPAPL